MTKRFFCQFLKRFRNYRIPASYSIRSTKNVICNFVCGTKHKMKKEKHLCCKTKNCEAEYLITSCSVLNHNGKYFKTLKNKIISQILYNIN